MYCTLDDILNIISEKELINLTNDWHRIPPSCTTDTPDTEETKVSSGTGAEAGALSAGQKLISGTGGGCPEPVRHVEEDRFEAVSAEADSLINGYLRARYKLPLSSTPTLIRTVAVDICAYRLYSRRSQKIPDHIVNNYNNAISTLKEIQKGNILLEVAGEDDEIEMPPLKTGFRCSKTARDRIFTDKMMRQYRGC